MFFPRRSVYLFSGQLKQIAFFTTAFSLMENVDQFYFPPMSFRCLSESDAFAHYVRPWFGREIWRGTHQRMRQAWSVLEIPPIKVKKRSTARDVRRKCSFVAIIYKRKCIVVIFWSAGKREANAIWTQLKIMSMQTCILTKASFRMALVPVTVEADCV